VYIHAPVPSLVLMLFLGVQLSESIQLLSLFPMITIIIIIIIISVLSQCMMIILTLLLFLPWYSIPRAVKNYE